MQYKVVVIDKTYTIIIAMKKGTVCLCWILWTVFLAVPSVLSVSAVVVLGKP